MFLKLNTHKTHEFNTSIMNPVVSNSYNIRICPPRHDYDIYFIRNALVYSRKEYLYLNNYI